MSGISVLDVRQGNGDTDYDAADCSQFVTHAASAIIRKWRDLIGVLVSLFKRKNQSVIAFGAI